jgi:hypothetical protein
MNPWTNEDGVALREFFRKVSPEKIAETMKSFCPVDITTETVLKNDAEAVARLAAMKAGWEAYEKNFLGLADKRQGPPVEADYKDMS